MLNAMTAANDTRLPANMRSRRSTMSAKAPAGTARKDIGRLSAACTNAIRVADRVSDVISHDAPTSCIQPPVLEMRVANQSARKVGQYRGLQGRAACAVPANGRCCSSFTGSRLRSSAAPRWAYHIVLGKCRWRYRDFGSGSSGSMITRYGAVKMSEYRSGSTYL
jgi:hypothetical protein